MFVAALAIDHSVNVIFQVRDANIAHSVQIFFLVLLSFCLSSLHSCASSFNPVSSQLFFLSRPQREAGQLEQNLRPCSAMDVSFTFGHRFTGYSPQGPGAKAKATPRTVSKCAQTLKCPVSSFKDEDLNCWWQRETFRTDGACKAKTPERTEMQYRGHVFMLFFLLAFCVNTQMMCACACERPFLSFTDDLCCDCWSRHESPV